MGDLSGELLRKHAMSLLSARYGPVKSEVRAAGKRADLFFTHNHLGRVEKVYVECKDYQGPLRRNEIERIWAAYEGIVRRNAPSLLLVVTRHGLTPDADAFIDVEHHELRHETIWDLENNVLGLRDYTQSLRDLFDEEGLSQYYIEARASEICYDQDDSALQSEVPVQSIYQRIVAWLDDDDNKPVAVLGGYGAGKSSLAKRIVALQAQRCLESPGLRNPVLIKLGVFTGHTRLEGLLGAMFTYDFPVPSFNTHRFLELNEKGRLLVVLDGFDEMKHAMTFADFRSQIIELNKLVRGKSKVILLGRPNAFLSIDEKYYVLRGRRRLADNEWHKVPGWPEFSEFRLADFAPQERHRFVLGYLRYLTSSGAGTQEPGWAESRAEEVNDIAERDPAVFGKPVHAKILTDLASDPQVDIRPLGTQVGRWRLYSLFFKSLIQKEVEKDARRAIAEDSRLDFLRMLAFWLWTEKAGQTAFHAFDVPLSILDAVPDGASVDTESKRREYLTGSFLEEKYGGTYFFHHRSFAEFLVADYMLANPPAGAAHAIYAALLREGVEEFLLEAPDPENVTGWVKGLDACSETLPSHYLDVLTRIAGGAKSLVEQCRDSSPWKRFFTFFSQSISLEGMNSKSALRAIRSGGEKEALMALSLLSWKASTVDSAVEIRDQVKHTVAAIMDRIFTGAKTNILHELRVPESGRFLGEVLALGARRAPGFQPTRRETWAVALDVVALARSADVALKKRGISFSFELEGRGASAPLVCEVPAMEVSPRMEGTLRPLFLEYIERNSSFDELPYDNNRTQRRGY